MLISVKLLYEYAVVITPGCVHRPLRILDRAELCVLIILDFLVIYLTGHVRFSRRRGTRI